MLIMKESLKFKNMFVNIYILFQLMYFKIAKKISLASNQLLTDMYDRNFFKKGLFWNQLKLFRRSEQNFQFVDQGV